MHPHNPEDRIVPWGGVEAQSRAWIKTGVFHQPAGAHALSIAHFSLRQVATGLPDSEKEQGDTTGSTEIAFLLFSGRRSVANFAKMFQCNREMIPWEHEIPS
jgi:hypothetical protein